MSGIVITCPDCQTRYRAETESLGEEGRTVRCAKCGSTWFVPAPDVIDSLVADPDALALADNIEAETTPPVTAEPPSHQVPADPVLDGFPTAEHAHPSVPNPAPPEPPEPPEPMRAPPAPQRSLSTSPPSETAPSSAATKDVSVGADVVMRDFVDREKLQRRRRTIRIIWAIPLVLVIIAAVIAVLNRQEIVNRFPTTASLYQSIGLEVRAGGLEIDPPNARTILVDGATVIRVESVVRNLTRTAKIVPQIELTLYGTDGQNLVQWYVDPNPDRIDPRGRLVFTSEISDPPAGAVGLRYRFADDVEFTAANGQ